MIARVLGVCFVTQAWSAGDYSGALGLYDEALDLLCHASEHDGDVSNAHAVLLSNRAAVYTQLQQYDSALADADAALLLRPAWDKAFFRSCFLLLTPQAGRVMQKKGPRD